VGTVTFTLKLASTHREDDHCSGSLAGEASRPVLCGNALQKRLEVVYLRSERPSLSCGRALYPLRLVESVPLQNRQGRVTGDNSRGRSPGMPMSLPTGKSKRRRDAD
jgi:hypothetical protein